MEGVFQYIVSGLSQGSIYTIVALGVVLTYRSNRVLNFAHGDITTAGTFIAFALITMKFPFSLAALLSLLFGAVLSMIFYFAILVPAQRREATHLGQQPVEILTGRKIGNPGTILITQRLPVIAVMVGIIEEVPPPPPGIVENLVEFGIAVYLVCHLAQGTDRRAGTDAGRYHGTDH